MIGFKRSRHASLQRACISSIASGVLALVSIEAEAELIPGRILDDPIILPGPEPAQPDARLVAPWLESLRRLRVDISESGLVSVASGGETGELEPLVELQPAPEPWSGSWAPPFETSLELGPSGLRASLAHEGETILSASGYALLPWQVSLARHSWFNLDLDGDRLRFEPGLEVVPQIVWGGLRLQTAGLRSEWVEEEGLQICSPTDSIRIGYAVAGALSALEIGGKFGVEITEMAFEQADWRGELSLGLAPRTGACMIRPQATLSILEGEGQLQSFLRLGVTSDLMTGQLIDLMIEYPRLELSELSLHSFFVPEQRLVLRLAF